MATLLAITTNPQAFTTGTWPSTQMNGATWRFTFTFTSSSASGAYSGYHALFTAPNGGNSGGLWIAGASLEFYNLADQILAVRDPMTWTAGATLRLTFDMVAKTITIAGMTTGNGVVPWSGSGPYFNGLDTLTAGGLVGQPGYEIAGTFGNIDDGVNSIVVDPAAVAITASDIGLRFSRRMVIDHEAVAITAEDVGLKFARRMVLDEATVEITAEDIGGRTAIPTVSTVITASDIGLRFQRRMALDPVAVTITANPIGGTIDPWTATEDAIHGWAVAGSGLDANHVIWGRNSAKNGPMPSGTFISMRLLGLASPCNGWLVSEEVDGEIEHRVIEPGFWTLEVSCFHADPFGATRAQLILKRLLASIRLPSVKAALKAGNVGVGPRGQIRLIDGTRSGMLDPRAIVEVGLHVMVETADEPGYAIERARVTNGITGTESWSPEPPA